MNQLKKNFIYNMVYQILVLILPLITVPYISRVIGVEGVGMYSYTYSIVYYFMLIGLLGINNYGNRTIAKVKENKEELSKNFICIYSIQVFMNILMIIIYALYLFFFKVDYEIIAGLQIIYLFSNMFDINWFFFGLEKFKLTVTRSTLLKLISLAMIFMFVNDRGDVWIYTLIMSGSTFFSQLLLFSFLKKEICLVKVSFDDIKKHIKYCLILFVPVIAVSLYKVMDKVMLGILTGVLEVGYYEQAEKIVTIPNGIITALGTIMLPRISNMVSKGEEEKIKEYIFKSVKFMMFLAFPLCFGLISISENFIPLFLGSEFAKSSFLMSLLSVTIIFLSFANILRTQYLIPKERDKDYIISVILGAIINLVINALLIPKLLSVGACIGTVLAEFFVMFYQAFKLRRDLPIRDYLVTIIPFFLKSLVMFGCISLLNLLNFNSFLIVLLQIVLGCLIYFVLNLKYINEIVNIGTVLKKIRGLKNEKTS